VHLQAQAQPQAGVSDVVERADRAGGRVTTLAEVGLGGAMAQLRVKDPVVLRDCVLHLLSDEHGHHFAVVGEGETLMMSWMAVNCLRDAELIEG